jgi:hypothetical protein
MPSCSSNGSAGLSTECNFHVHNRTSTTTSLSVPCFRVLPSMLLAQDKKGKSSPTHYCFLPAQSLLISLSYTSRSSSSVDQTSRSLPVSHSRSTKMHFVATAALLSVALVATAAPVDKRQESYGGSWGSSGSGSGSGGSGAAASASSYESSTAAAVSATSFASTAATSTWTSAAAASATSSSSSTGSSSAGGSGESNGTYSGSSLGGSGGSSAGGVTGSGSSETFHVTIFKTPAF